MKKKFMRLSLLLCTTLLFITGVKAAYSDSDINNARENGAGIKTVASTGKIPSDYSFALGQVNPRNYEVKNNDTTNLEAVVNQWAAVYTAGQLNFPEVTTSLAKDSIKGKFYILYKGVDVYNDKLIDVKATVMDFKTVDNPASTPLIKLYNTALGNTVIGIKWVTVKYEFFESGTNTPVNVKGNTSYWDVDAYQGIIIENNNDRLYATNDAILKITKINGKNYVYNDGGHTETNDPKYGFSETFSGTSITRTFTYGSATASPVGMGHSSKAVVPADPTAPTKAVNKSSVQLGEEYTYTITQKVPLMISNYYYKSFVIEDTLENVLSVNANNVSITNESSTNVTSKFNVTVSGQKISISPKNIADADFYGHTYNIKIKTNVKTGSDLTKYKQGDEYIIPNYATSKIADHENTMHEQKTKIVNVKVSRIKVNYVIVGNVRPDSSKTDKTPGTDIIDKGTKYNAASQLKTNDTTKSYTFKGWYTDEALTKKYVDGTVLNQDTTLYGAWEATVIVNVPPTAAQTPLIIAGLGLLVIAGGTTYYILNNKKSNK
ncbi:MAG: isopeptide-forming domain-containing fimbrial protein [Bacilli bacterium]|nr:isopeptide-forming domain-containing fimbrial protein [Bacilli bacterium]